MEQKTIIKLLKALLTLCFIFIFNINIFSQQLSTYEKKRYDLAEKTLTAMIEEDPFGIGLAFAFLSKEANLENLYDELDFFEETITSLGIGNSLMNIDPYTGNNLKEHYQNWKQQLAILDKTKTKADIDREKERKNPPENGTYKHLIRLIKEDFTNWAKKGEYEKKSELQERLKKHSQSVFDSICYVKCNSIWHYSEFQKVQSGEYDADTECKDIIIEYGNEKYGKHKIIGLQHIPLDDEKKSYDIKALKLSDIQISNNFVLPKQLIWYYKLNNLYKIDTVEFQYASDGKPLEIAFKDLGFIGDTIIHNILKDYRFNLNSYIKERKAKYDSTDLNISISTISNYWENKIDSLNSIYNLHNISTWHDDNFHKLKEDFERIKDHIKWFKPHGYCETKDFIPYIVEDYKYSIIETHNSMKDKLKTIERKLMIRIINQNTNELIYNYFKKESIGKISKATFENDNINFYIKKEIITGHFENYMLSYKDFEWEYRSSIKNFYYPPQVLSTSDKKLIIVLYKEQNSFNGNLEDKGFLIKDNNKYDLSGKVVKQLSSRRY